MRWPVRTIEERFWPKVQKNEGNKCWLWTGACTSDGYGNIRGIDGRPVGAHRVAYELQVGPIPQGASVLHTCDNPPCVRRDHLFLGTQAKNIADMFSKGRGNRAKGGSNGSRLHPERRPHLWGEASGHAVLTWEQVSEIRAAYRPRRVSQAMLAKRYGVSPSTVQFLLQEKTWRKE